MGIVLSLCDRTANMVRPWADAGYECWIVDIQHPPGISPAEGGIKRIGADVREFKLDRPASIVFAFPPCTHLAVSGSRWFKAKGLDALHEAIGIVAACKRICLDAAAPYMIENPVGVLSTYWRKPDHIFNPCDYAGYLDNPNDEAYTKKTCLWTGRGFVMPERKPVEPVMGSKMHRLPPSEDRADIRSVTPNGFAEAVFLANKGV